MKKFITFGHSTAILEHSKSAASITVTPVPGNTSLPTQIAELADKLNESDIVDVSHIFPDRGKIVFTVERSATNANVIEVVCDALTCVFETDTIVSNERAQNAL